MPRPLFAHLAGLVVLLFLALFLGYPLYVILARSLTSTEGLAGIVTNPYYLGRLLFTTVQALLSTLLTVVLALPSALIFARYRFVGKRFIRSAFTIPFVMPTVVAATGFLALVGPRGVLGVNLRGTLLIVLLAHVFYNYAVVVRIVSGYLEKLGPRLSEASRLLGANPARTLWRVTLPLAAPAVVAAALLVFIFCFTSFGVIVILAPGPQLATLEVDIYRLTARLLQLERAAVLAGVQLLVVMAFTLLYTAVQARLAVPLQTGGQLAKPGPVGTVWVALNLAVAGVLVLSPLLALLGQALAAQGAWPSLGNFVALGEAPRSVGFAGVGLAVRNSLRFAVGSTALALVLGLLSAYAVVRAGWRWLDSLSLLPLATSAVTLGFGYLLAFPLLRASAWGLVLAHTLIAFPFVVRTILPALRGLPPTLTQAARTLGSGPLRVLARLELPLITPTLVAAASFAFAVSIGEFGATLILSRPEYATIPVAIYDRLGRPGATNYGSALALAVLLMVVTGGVMLLLERFGQGEL